MKLFHRFKDNKTLLISMLVIMTCILVQVDRVFFKRSSSFSVRFLYSCLPVNPEWDLPPLDEAQEILLDRLLKQKFHYLAKGTHCFAFVSADSQYVIKFHKYPSHMRIFPWLTHPFSYHFSERRKKIKEHNFQRLGINLISYKNSYLNLQDETGIIFAQLNQTGNLRRKITLVDKSGAEHKVSLSNATFIIQKRADLIYPTLDKLVAQGKIDEAKHVVSKIIQLITSCCQKGYVDEDPILSRNYGLLPDRAIHIDVGDLVQNEKVMLRENYIPYVKEITESLRKRIESNYPELLEHYSYEIELL